MFFFQTIIFLRGHLYFSFRVKLAVIIRAHIGQWPFKFVMYNSVSIRLSKAVKWRQIANYIFL